MDWDRFVRDIPFEDRIGLVWPMTDTLLMEAAMVLWEEYIAAEAREWKANPGVGGPLTAYRDPIGTVAVRHDIMGVVPALHIGWHLHEKAAGDSVLSPFDWEFAPWFLANCLEFDPHGWIDLKPDWMDQCKNLRGGG